MLLYLKRSERHTWLGGRRYQLTAHMEATHDERRIIHAHCFAEKLAYIDNLDHVEELERRVETACQGQRKLSAFNPDDLPAICWQNAKVLALALRANYSLAKAYRLSVHDLMTGAVMETPNINELLQVEATITKTFDALKLLVDHAATFEQNTETVLEPDHQVDDDLAPPSTWPRYSRG